MNRHDELAALLSTPGVTAVEVAKQVGVSDAYVGMMARGERPVTEGVLVAARELRRRALARRLADYAIGVVSPSSPPASEEGARLLKKIGEVVRGLRTDYLLFADELTDEQRDGIDLGLTILETEAMCDAN